jgi:hypothetical protein
MNFHPRNKYLHVEVIENALTEDQDVNILLPKGFDKNKKEQHKLVKLLSAPPNSPYQNDIGKDLVVASHMVEEITVLDKMYTVISESSVYGIFYD